MLTFIVTVLAGSLCTIIRYIASGVQKSDGQILAFHKYRMILIVLCHGHLAVEWASWWNGHLGGTGILVERAYCRGMGILVERASCPFQFPGGQYAHATPINPLIQKRCSAVLGRQCGLGEAARSWGGSAVLGVSPMSDCRGFPHERLPFPQQLPWFPP